MLGFSILDFDFGFSISGLHIDNISNTPAAQKDLRGKARERLTSAGVLSLYVEARQRSATQHMRLFQQSA
jgi:hypothetical protein